jgi:hypothetical protein
MESREIKAVRVASGGAAHLVFMMQEDTCVMLHDTPHYV